MSEFLHRIASHLFDDVTISRVLDSWLADYGFELANASHWVGRAWIRLVYVVSWCRLIGLGIRFWCFGSFHRHCLRRFRWGSASVWCLRYEVTARLPFAQRLSRSPSRVPSRQWRSCNGYCLKPIRHIAWAMRTKHFRCLPNGPSSCCVVWARCRSRSLHLNRVARQPRMIRMSHDVNYTDVSRW